VYFFEDRWLFLSDNMFIIFKIFLSEARGISPIIALSEINCLKAFAVSKYLLVDWSAFTVLTEIKKIKKQYFMM
jgi:hypothetical protein